MIFTFPAQEIDDCAACGVFKKILSDWILIQGAYNGFLTPPSPGNTSSSPNVSQSGACKNSLLYTADTPDE